MLMTAIFTIIPMATESASAAENRAEETETMSQEEQSVEPRILTNLALTLDGESSEITAAVKNVFTLFPSTVYVNLELYVSDTYTNGMSYLDMELVERKSALDLNMGESISITVSTQGRQRYWCARMRYKIDNDSPDERVTMICLYAADGMLIEKY